ncbi:MULTISPECIES: hypothetical protein [Acinetobacter]|uniref:Uncharacterized protein n=1 Tax=Acinetobacter piscicola TaxID=2006115 RepID=A0A7S7AJQ7_9GAMM|nr:MULTISPECIES: hypothetical protein [Acinetobacter]QOW48274.1 hypothetical protein G0028_20735 [Acinetobacter piscicola]
MDIYQDCSCSGNNENCFKCYGTGRIIDENKTSTPKSIKVLSTNHTRFKKESYKKEVFILKKNIDGKIYKEFLVKCKICAKLIEKIEIKNHIIKHNSMNHIESSQETNLVKKQKITLRTLILCPICNVRVKGVKYEKHMFKVHGKNIDLSNFKINVSSGSFGIYDDVIEKKINNDATKLYAHNFRENGKFGSHPEHDNYD